jgi:dipeptidyl aminopeptidase/acylaminoacyl peptidase
MNASRRLPFVRRIGCLTAPFLLLAFVDAQQLVLEKEDYLTPPQEILSVLTSDGLHNRVALTNLGPDGEHFLVRKSGGMPSLAQYSRPYLNLGETPIDHRAMRSRRLSTGNTIGYDLVNYKTGTSVSIQVISGVTVSGGTFSPDGKKVAFLANADTATHLHVADVSTGRSRRVTDTPLLATHVTSFRWTTDSKQILTVLVPKDPGAMPQRSAIARQPKVWVTHDGKTPTRTYRFLLKTPYDKKLLEYLSTGQLALVNVSDGSATDIGKPAMFTSIDVAPSGQFFRVTTMQKPFSYFVPTRSFGTKDELWDRQGHAVQLIQERKLRIGQSNNRRGGRGDPNSDRKRSLTWRPDGNGLSYLQRAPAEKPAEKPTRTTKAKKKPAKSTKAKKTQTKTTPMGKPKAKQKRKDRVMHWPEPFKKDGAKVIWESEETIESVAYSEDCRTIFLTQTIKGQRQVFAVNLNAPKKKLKIHETKVDPSAGGQRRGRFRRRGGAGRGLLTKAGRRGGRVVRTSRDKKSVYMPGTDPAKDPKKDLPRAYLDSITINSGEKKRLWQAPTDARESMVTPVDDDCTGLIISRETRTEVPNSYLRDTKTGKLRRLTHNFDPAPEVTAAKRMRFQVERVDGFKFFVRVTIPKNYGTRLPAMFWFYPREFTSQKAYDARQRPQDPHRFPGVSTRSMEMLTMLGYVVVQPDCPIVGPEGRMNDNFVADLRNSLWAVIDDLDRKQIIDRNRLAIGGHSYGAFGTANALAHTPFFKAGIAGDGNYNRTLTPMSFQAERREVWAARETYLRMSPLLWANQVNGALLMYHGMDDNNTGTFPIHSPRMFQALNGLGKKASLYMYPYEGHGPAARETILDLWSRWIEWLDIHVKDPSRGKAKKKATAKKDITEGKK